MTTVARAWEAFLDAIAEAQRLHASGGCAAAVQDLLQHARELLDIIADEIAMAGASLPEPARSGLEQLRKRLVSLESDLVVKH